jgi:catechol 2,3-dioxygenase-like lactoylglutathione lyase family enzyme
MLYDAIDHLILPVVDLIDAALPFERLGLRVTPGVRHAGLGTENRTIRTGAGPQNVFYVELLGIADEQEASANPFGEVVKQAIAAGRGVTMVLLRVRDMQAVAKELGGRGLEITPQMVTTSDGMRICDVAPLATEEQAGFNLACVEYATSIGEIYERFATQGAFDHAFPLKRLDHLAAFTRDLPATTRFWSDVLGIPVAGEVTTPAMAIHQMRVGDAVLELLGAASPESPLASRPPGMASMAAFEVPDLDAAVAQARAAGFSAADPAKGVLPGTRTSTIPPAELAGMALQLLQYV